MPAVDAHIAQLYLQLAARGLQEALLTFTSSGAYTRTLRDETSGTDLDQKQWIFIPPLCKSVKMHLKMDETDPCGWRAVGYSLSFIVDGFVYNSTKRR